MKQKEIPNIADFKLFLSEHIFKEPILSLYQFKRGASSFNYLATLKNKKILVKLAWKHKKSGVERLVNIISILSKNKHLPVAKIIPVNKKEIFKYQNSYGFLLEYVDGISLPATQIKQHHINEIIEKYKIFHNTDFSNKSLLVKEYDFNNIHFEYSKTAQLTLKKNKKHIIYSFFAQQCVNALHEIGSTPLTINSKKKEIIHGDFHHNNLLFKNNHLVSILDFEDIGYGYVSEDLLRFIFCLIARQPLFVSKRKQLKNYLSYVTKNFDYSYDQWMVGLNSFTLQKAKKLFNKEPKPSFSTIKKMVQFLVFMRLYRFVKNTLRKNLI